MTSQTFERSFPRWFWGLWSAQLINRIASFAQPFLVLFLTTDRGVSAAQAGAISSGVGIGAAVATLAGGWAADIFGRRGTMLVSQATTAASLVWLAVAQDLWQLWDAAIAVGLGSSLLRPAVNATVGDVIAPSLQVRAFGLLYWAVNLGFSAATLTAGILVRWGYPTMFLINAVASAVAGLMIWHWVPETRPAAESDTKLPFLTTFFADRVMVMLIFCAIGYSVISMQAYTVLPLVMTDQGLSPTIYGFTLATNGVVICLAQPLATRIAERLRPERVYAVGLAIYGLGFTLTIWAHTPLQHGLVVVVWTIGEIATSTVFSALINARAPQSLRARYHGVPSTAFAVGIAIGPPLGTWALTAIGASGLWISCGVLGVISALVVLATPELRTT